MHINNTIQAFEALKQVFDEATQTQNGTSTNKYASELQEITETLKHKNGWFIPEQVRYAIAALSFMISDGKLATWLSAYTFPQTTKPQKIALILAGNIPLSGFHDLLCVLAAGHIALVKLSSKDAILPVFIKKFFDAEFPDVGKRIIIEENFITGIDAVIATGSNNSSRYFQYYFGKYPHIIRNNRNSVAVITGTETQDEMDGLADDIFLYFGLGCRSISKIYLPKGYEPEKLLSAFNKYSHYKFHNKYANNYDYRKAIYLMNQEPFIDGHFYILRPNHSIHSDVAVLHYEFYESLDQVWEELKLMKDNLQCVVSKAQGNISTVLPGKAQFPELNDYADEVDTMQFLLSLK